MDLDDKIMYFLIVPIVGVSVLVLVGVFILLLSLPFITIQSPGSGTHTGYITATETNGWLWPTMRAYVKTDAQSSQEDSYCVEDKMVYQQLKNLEESKTPVNISYESHLIVPNWKCKGENAIIVGVSARTN